MNILVEATSPTATTGTLTVNGKTYPCTIGRSGVIAADKKTEGDGKTPLGIYPLRTLYYRADRVAKPETGLPTEILTPDMGWCEDPASPDYNKKIVLSEEDKVDRMTRDDALYDYTVIIGHNDDPVVPGKGSAVFMHLARPEFTPTAGCVGLTAADMREVLKTCSESSTIEIRLVDGAGS